MSTQRKREQRVPESPVTDSTVASYLQSHPDFFEHHDALLARMKIPHGAGTAAVSLIERQVSVLRASNRKLDRKLRELVSVARANESLSRRIYKLAGDLIAARDISQALATLENALSKDFGADVSTLILFQAKGSERDLFESPFLRRVDPASETLKPFATFLTVAKPRCGQVREAQKNLLFGPDHNDVGSAALVPLGENAQTGILAVGSRNSTHFHPGMSTDFLARIGELVTAALTRCRR